MSFGHFFHWGNSRALVIPWPLGNIWMFSAFCYSTPLPIAQCQCAKRIPMLLGSPTTPTQQTVLNCDYPPKDPPSIIKSSHNAHSLSFCCESLTFMRVHPSPRPTFPFLFHSSSRNALIFRLATEIFHHCSTSQNRSKLRLSYTSLPRSSNVLRR